MRAGGGEGGAVGGWCGAVAGDGGNDARGIDAADALVVGIGEVEIAFGIERNVAGLLEAVGVALVLQVGERDCGAGGGSAVAAEGGGSRSGDGGDDAGLGCKRGQQE